MNKKFILFLLGICLLFTANSQTRYYYNFYLTPVGGFWNPSSKDSAEFYSDTDLDTVYYGGATIYYKTGEIYSRDFYEFGYLSGTRRFYKNGKKRYVMSSGTTQSSIEDGTRMKVFTLNSYVGVDNSWDSIGNRMVKQGNGYFQNFYGNGKVMCEGEYKEGASVGDWKGYYQNGNLMYDGRYTSNYHGWLIQTICSNKGDTLVKNGSGNFILYYPNGKGSVKGRCSWGVLVDELIIYYPNGNIREKSFRINGFFDGLFETFYDNGKIACEGKYNKGRKVGEWKWYDKLGNQIRYKKYEFLN